MDSLLHCGDTQSTTSAIRAHVMQKYRTVFKICQICETRKLWSFSMLRCKECSFTCHKKCMARTRRMLVCLDGDSVISDDEKNGATTTVNPRNPQMEQLNICRRRAESSFCTLRLLPNLTRIATIRPGRNDPYVRPANVAIANQQRDFYDLTCDTFRCNQGTPQTCPSESCFGLLFCYRLIVVSPFVNLNLFVHNTVEKFINLRTVVRRIRQNKSSSARAINRKPKMLPLTCLMAFGKTNLVADKSQYDDLLSFKKFCSKMADRHRVRQLVRNNFGVPMSPISICEL